MVASFTLLILSFVSIFVHADLWLVYRKKAHLFAPLFQLIPVKQRKTYQGAYRNSLKRQYYCVQDKVDVSGTTFTACFTVLYAYLFMANLMSTEKYISALNFWLQGVFWYIYLLYCLGSYRDMRELCFYCYYELIQGATHCILGFIVMTENFQWAFLVLVILVFSCVIFVRQAHKEDREEARLRKLRRDQYKKKVKDDDDDNDSGQGVSIAGSGEDYSGAYLTRPADKKAPAPPPASTKRSSRGREPLSPIPEGDQLLEEEEADGQTREQEAEEDEDIEVIECPGIDGVRQRNHAQARFVHPMMQRGARR